MSIVALLLLMTVSGPAKAADLQDTGVTQERLEAQENTKRAPPEGAASLPALVKQAQTRRRPPPPPPQSFQQRHRRELLALLGLLILWLLARVWGSPNNEGQRRTKRHSPLNAEELARVTFGIVRSSDEDAYRSLYLSGAEAVRTMGESAAKEYMEGRSSEAFGVSFFQLRQRIPADSRFEGGVLAEGDVVELLVRAPDGQRRQIPIGIVVHVGAVVRLLAPVTEIEPAALIEILPE